MATNRYTRRHVRLHNARPRRPRIVVRDRPRLPASRQCLLASRPHDAPRRAPPPRDRLAWTEHVATRLMAEALAHIRADPNQLSAPSPADPGLDPGRAHSADEPAEPWTPTGNPICSQIGTRSAGEAKPPAPAAIP